MVGKRLYFAGFLAVLVCQFCWGQSSDQTSIAGERDAQLEINQKALLEGSNDAASIMLYDDNTQARKILLDILSEASDSQATSEQAKVAICKALIQARGAEFAIKNKQDFIAPLLKLLTEGDTLTAGLAAEATMIFEYSQISKQLEKLVSDTSLPAEARVKGIEALKRPDMKAIFKLIDMLDDDNSQVVGAAGNALNLLGIPVVGKDAKTREQIRIEIKRKGPDKFLRDWLIRQEAQTRQLEKDLDFWKKRYFVALDRLYDNLTEDEAKGQFLVDHLTDAEDPVKLWALQKVYQGWVGTGTKSVLLGRIEPVLVVLISDTNRDVRLKTAELLSLMGSVNSAQKLLEQHGVEADEQVKDEIFVALGVACHYAFSNNSGIEIDEKIRKKTLELAVDYLASDESAKAKKGAEVIRKLLEQNGLESSVVDRYLDLLSERYEKARDGVDEYLRGGLIEEMAGLCAQSVYKERAAKKFGLIFEKALADEADLVRKAAVNGLVYIDPTNALNVLRGRFVNDTALIEVMIELAGKVGGKEDLDWLAEKVGKTGESDSAFPAMIRIFKRPETGASVMGNWMESIGFVDANSRLSDEQRIAFLVIAERKAAGEKKEELLNSVRKMLAELYMKTVDFERAAEYWGLLRDSAIDGKQKQAIDAKLLEAYLKKPNIEAAKNLVENYLLQKDFEIDGLLLRSIDEFFNTPQSGENATAALKGLEEIKLSEPRPNWQKKLKSWSAYLRESTK